MFFEKIDEIPKIARNTGTAVFVVPKDKSVELKNAFLLQPENRSIITIEQVRNMMARISTKQTRDVYVVIRPAEAMSEEAANAFLKHFEEPNEKVHFVLITDSPSRILPTILSRAAVYFWKDRWQVDGEIVANDKVKDMAKKLMIAKGAELVDLAEKIAKKKDEKRAYTMEILGVAIEMLYRTYLLTGKDVFLVKIPKFLQAYDAISKNGNIKLQIVSNLC